MFCGLGWLSVILSHRQSLGYVGHVTMFTPWVTHHSIVTLLTLTAELVTLFTHSGTHLFMLPVTMLALSVTRHSVVGTLVAPSVTRHSVVTPFMPSAPV